MSGRNKQTLTLELLRERVDYNSDTGCFTWRQKCRGQVVVGSVAGRIDKDGYRIFQLHGVTYRAHRLAWFWCNGVWPEHEIDHINGNRDDNRIANLRPANKSENQQNLAVARVTNRSGLLGAHLTHGWYYSRIKVGGVTHRLGKFTTAEAAHQAYLKAKKSIHTHNERALHHAAI